jgi:hypothetical protein
MLTKIIDGIWGYEQELKLPLGMRLPSRTTIVRLADGGLVMHSPLDFDAETAEAIDDLGEVKSIVAPSCVHYLFLAAATKRWPRARVLGAPGLEEKGPARGVAFDPLPHDGVVDGLGDDLVVRRIDGVPYMTEHVFLHRPSASLLVTDLVFNLHRCSSWGMRLYLRCMGAWEQTAQSKIWRLFTKDRSSAAESARAVLAWDFDRVVVAHGDVVTDNAHATLERALTRMVSGGPVEARALAART